MSRSRRILALLQDERRILALLQDDPIPKYETTVGSSSKEQLLALQLVPKNLFDVPSVCHNETAVPKPIQNVAINILSDVCLSPIVEMDQPIIHSRPDLGIEENATSSSESISISSDQSEYIPDSSTTGSSSINQEVSENSPENYKLPDASDLTVPLLDSISSLNDLKTTASNIEQSNNSQIDQQNTNSKNEKKKKLVKVKRISDLCYFCETNVLNFARHLITCHKGEPEVQKIISYPPNYKVRKNLITDIRKRGNHLVNINQCVKPVKKSHLTENADYLPCKHCLGYYRPKQLWRHIKRAHDNNGSYKSHQSESHNILVKHLPIDTQLRDTVFPRMRADKIGLAAKEDLLICKFGSRYLKSHREKHLISVCSRKMRELARLLIEVQKINPSIKNLYDALRPEYFDTFVESTKKVAQYDSVKEVFHSPTYTMNIQTSLKQCYDIAILFTIKRKQIECSVSTADQEANFTSFKQLLQDDWRYEVSTIAAADLSTKKWNKLTILPLAQDLKFFRTYLLAESERAIGLLRVNETDMAAYQLLIETIFCRLILLNRKRVREMERLPLHVYQEAGVYRGYEEFRDTVTPSERILLKKVKRVVTRGKRGRGVPVLFTLDLQQHTSILINLRPNFLSNHLNIYLFPKLKNNNPITGYKVLEKHAKKSGARNPNALTSTRLRKHLATLTQLFDMGPNDIEQLATFMGHTNTTHNQVYRLPDDVYQTAKISKLLMLMEKGEAGKYKGMSLNDIDLDLEEEEDILPIHSESDIEDGDLFGSMSDCSKVLASPKLSTSTSKSPISYKTLNKKTRILVPWTQQQKTIAKTFFADHIMKKYPPKKKECETLKEDHPKTYNNKTWSQIKVFIQNLYRSN